MSDEKDRIQDEDVEGHKRQEDMTGDDTEGHSGKKVREDTTGDDDTEGHRRGL